MVQVVRRSKTVIRMKGVCFCYVLPKKFSSELVDRTEGEKEQSNAYRVESVRFFYIIHYQMYHDTCPLMFQESIYPSNLAEYVVPRSFRYDLDNIYKRP